MWRTFQLITSKKKVTGSFISGTDRPMSITKLFRSYITKICQQQIVLSEINCFIGISFFPSDWIINRLERMIMYSVVLFHHCRNRWDLDWWIRFIKQELKETSCLKCHNKSWFSFSLTSYFFSRVLYLIILLLGSFQEKISLNLEKTNNKNK